MIRFIFSVLFWVALIIILIFFGVVVFLPPVNPFVIYALLFGFSCLPAILIIFLLHKFFYNSLINLYKNAVGGRTAKLFATGITTAVFISAINLIIRTLVFIPFRLTASISENFIRAWRDTKDLCPVDDLSGFNLDFYYYFPDHFLNVVRFFSSECFSQISMSILRVWNFSLESIFIGQSIGGPTITNLPFGKIFLALVVWTILVRVLDRIDLFNEDNTDSQGLMNVDWIRRVYTEPIRSNILFFTILGVGVYLSIASIAAIPSLQGSADGTALGVNAETLSEQLDDYVLSFQQRFPVDNNEFQRLREIDPFLPVKRILEQPTAVSENDSNGDETVTSSSDESVSQSASETTDISASTPANQLIEQNDDAFPPYLISNVERNIDRQNQRRNELISSGERMIVNFNDDINTRARNVKTQYEVSSSARKGERETVEHFLLLTQWFGSYSGEMERQISNCTQSLNTLDVSLESWSTNIASLLRSDVESSYLDDSLYNSTYLDSSWNGALRSCDNTLWIESSEIPARPELGDYLGPFRFVASWLLRTESLPLTLITGLVGFGLLGSACSSFVRERAEPLQAIEQTPLVQDLPKVVIIGLSAAILAFLSVMGGLAIFFSTGSNPNPYALLLGCLIAATFGEDVWQWARRRLRENLKNPKGENESAESSQPNTAQDSAE